MAEKKSKPEGMRIQLKGLRTTQEMRAMLHDAINRLEELGMPKYYNATNPAKWMSTSTDVYELVNFFEAQNTAYEVDASGHSHEKKEEEK